MRHYEWLKVSEAERFGHVRVECVQLNHKTQIALAECKSFLCRRENIIQICGNDQIVYVRAKVYWRALDVICLYEFGFGILILILTATWLLAICIGLVLLVHNHMLFSFDEISEFAPA